MAASDGNIEEVIERTKKSIEENEIQLTGIQDMINQLPPDSDESADLRVIELELLELLKLEKEEYLRLKKIVTLKNVGITVPKTWLTNQSDQHINGDDVQLISDDLVVKELVPGQSCRVPLRLDDGQVSLHNSMINSVNDGQVEVLFTHPVNASMKTCPYFMDGNCRYGAIKCRFNHGHRVSKDQINDKLNFEDMKLDQGSPCLVKQADGDLWMEGTVVNVTESDVEVKLNQSNSVVKVKPGEAVPIETIKFDDGTDDVIDLSSDDDCDDDDDCTMIAVFGGDNSNGMKSVDMKQTIDKDIDECQPLACWESYTKGIGSKLLLKMGYKWGQGLGKRGDGIKEPVQAATYVIPGRSLDHVMDIKNGKVVENHSSFRKKKRKEFKERKSKAKIAERYKFCPKFQSPTVFNFINDKLSAPSDADNVLDINKPSTSRASTSQLNEKKGKNRWLEQLSDVNLNVKVLQTSESIEKLELEQLKLKQSMERNMSKDKLLTNQLISKSEGKKKMISDLKIKLQQLKQEQKSRSMKSKLTNF